jgi:RNA polymerase primary sigma factor
MKGSKGPAFPRRKELLCLDDLVADNRDRIGREECVSGQDNRRPNDQEADMPVVSKTIKPRISRQLRARVEPMLAIEYAYMDSPVFKQKSIEDQLFAVELPPLPLVAWYQPTRDELSEAMKGTPQLMSSAEEQLMFRRFNFAKRKLKITRKKILADGLTRPLAEAMVLWFERMEHLREYLVRTNLALVLAMAKRTRLGDVDFAEIVSEGNMALLRAIEKFSVDRGFKFSTYACRAILKAFSRTAQKHSKYRTRFPVEFEPDYEKSDYVDRKRDAAEDDLVAELKTIVEGNLAELSDVEQTVLRNRFNWKQEMPHALTLEEVGEIIGVTKERVRQIQNKALAKIRRIMDDGTQPATEEAAAV